VIRAIVPDRCLDARIDESNHFGCEITRTGFLP